MKKAFAPVVSLVLTAAAVFSLGFGVSPVGATTTAEYASNTVSGTTGSISFVGNFPSATFSSQRTVPGRSAAAVLDASTPFGAVYGSSVGKFYIRLDSPVNSGSSSTVFTFASATPATGFGFTLGDIDNEAVTVSATTTGGVAVTAVQLGFNVPFNYASGADVPTWNAGTSTLVGNVADTSGASGWFSPTIPLETITFTSTTLSASPEYQVWMAALIPDLPTTTTTTPVTTTIATTTTTPSVTTTFAITTSTTSPISINPSPSVSSLPTTGNDLDLAYVAMSVLFIGIVMVAGRKRHHYSRPN